MSFDRSAYLAHLDTHPVADDDAIGLIRRDLSYDGPGDPTGDRAFYQRVLAQYDALATQLPRYQDAVPGDLAHTHPKLPDSDHCQSCGGQYPCPTLVIAARHGLTVSQNWPHRGRPDPRGVPRPHEGQSTHMDKPLGTSE